METKNIGSILHTSYDYGFRKGAHQLIAWGYEDVLSKLHDELGEEEITGFITEAVDNRLEDPYLPKEFVRFSIDEEKLISAEGRTGKSRRRLDIVITRHHPRPRPKYVFEAKRLRKTSHPIRFYTGEDGLQCYIKGIYASQLPEAAMIAYVQSHDCNYWQEKLREKFDRDSSNRLAIKQTLRRVQIINALADEWVSEHERTINHPIIIHHIFLKCF